MSNETSMLASGISGGISFETQKFAFGQRVGLQTDGTSTQAIVDAIDALTQMPNDLLGILDSLFGAGSDSPSATYGYDPSVKWLAGFAITYGVLTLDVLLVDGQFYGLLIKVGKKPDPKPPTPPPDKTGQLVAAGDKPEPDPEPDPEPTPDQPFAGLELEILYRKVNDHLGEYSADLTLPDKYKEISIGDGPEDPAAIKITLPSIGLAIWTNGDFKVSIGWPLGDRSFNISFPPDPIPWAGGGGLYFAKLRSEDATGLGTGFNPIVEFGIAIRIGVATEGKVAILEYAASLYLFGSFQGFLAWDDGHSFSSGLDYYWFCATVGITGHLEGSVDFAIVKVSLALDLTASLTLAIEKNHQTVGEAEFQASVTASVKIVFFTIHFSYDLDVKKDISFGSGDPALITGPSFPSTPAPRLAEANV